MNSRSRCASGQPSLGFFSARADASRLAGERLLADPLRRLLAWRPGADGRAIMLGIVAVYLGVVAAERLVWNVDVWPWLGVPSGPSLFFDARNLTAAWECQRLGYDTLYESPCDPQGRPLNYLRPWLLLGVLGLDQSDTFALASFLIVAMFLSFSLLVGRIPIGTGIVLASAVCSPAIMFAIERANMDIALFSLAAASVLVWRAFPSVAAIVSPVLVLLTAAAKVYGVFALPAFVLTRNRTAARAALLCLAVFAIYAVFSFRDIAHIAQIATQGDRFAYGARILPAHLYHQVGADRWSGSAVVKQLLAVVPLALIVTALTLWVRRRLAPTGEDAPTGTPSLLALHLGTLIYLGTFAVGNNFDYRLVFLLLTLPQLVEWARTPTHRLSSLALATLAAIIVMLWVGSLSQALSLWDEVASWTVAGLLAAIAAATVPPTGVVRDTVLRPHAPASHVPGSAPF